jgi:hypothetical protein
MTMENVIYGVWVITFFSGFYTVEVATERWGFSGRIGAFAVWIPGAMLTTLGVVLLLHRMWEEQLGLERKFMLGLLVGIVFNLIFVAIGWRAGPNNRHSVRESKRGSS